MATPTVHPIRELRPSTVAQVLLLQTLLMEGLWALDKHDETYRDVVSSLADVIDSSIEEIDEEMQQYLQELKEYAEGDLVDGRELP